MAKVYVSIRKMVRLFMGITYKAKLKELPNCTIPMAIITLGSSGPIKKMEEECIDGQAPIPMSMRASSPRGGDTGEALSGGRMGPST